jgi:ketosteroid isomerase-like protein
MSPNQHTPAICAVLELFAVVDSGDVDAICRRLTDDVYFQFGNAEPITGKPGFRQASYAFFDTIAASSHEILNIWEVDDGTVIAVMNVHYERLDGRKLSLPCCNLFRVRGGQVNDYRVFIDVNPVFAVP